MEDRGRLSRTLPIFLTAAALVVMIAGLRAARELVVPFLLAVFIAVLCLPLLAWLLRRGVPKLLAVILIAAAFLAAGAVLAVFVGMSVNDFVRALPDFQSRMDARTVPIFDWLKGMNIDVSAQGLLDYVAPNKAMTLVKSVVSSMGVMLGYGLLVFFIVGFILIEASSFPLKLRAAVRNPEKMLGSFQKFGAAAQRYLLVKTLTSAAEGLGIWLCLAIIGVDYALIWGLLAFMLNFVPYIGGTFATVPPVLLALVQLGVGPAIWTTLACVSVNTIIAIVEPMIMAGGSGGLSALVVFLSLVFWGWVLGPIGAVLSVPLTIIVKIALESHEDCRWVATMLGPVRAGGPRYQPELATDDAAKPQALEKMDKEGRLGGAMMN